MAKGAVDSAVDSNSAAVGVGGNFSADTQAATPSGERPISSLRVGDPVEAYNPATGKVEPEPVQHVWLNHDHDLVDVLVVPSSATTTAAARAVVRAVVRAATMVVGQTRTGHGLLVGDDVTAAVHLTIEQQSNTSSKANAGETIHTTANYPWLTADRGWVQAGDLRAGESLVTLNGATGTVAWVHTVSGQADMYNLTVAHDHTYAVGDGRWVVHNVGGPEPEDLIPLGDIHFTQASIAEHFKYGYAFEQTLSSMRAGTMTPWDYEEPIRVFQYSPDDPFFQSLPPTATQGDYTGRLGNLEPGKWYSLDNQRLALAKASLPEDYAMPVQYAQPNEIAGEEYKFSTTNGGVSVTGEQSGATFPPGPSGC